MGSLIGLKNIVIFSTVLFAIGSVSAQQAFAGGQNCDSIKNGDWNDPLIWIEECPVPPPDSSDDVRIFHDIIITGDEEARTLNINQAGSLFIDCDASLTVSTGGGSFGDITNHGDLTITGQGFPLLGGTLFNSGTISGVVEQGGSIVEISTICTQPIGGTVGSMDTVSLLVAGAQANTGWWIIALVGAVTVVGIAYKAKSNKTDKETL